MSSIDNLLQIIDQSSEWDAEVSKAFDAALQDNKVVDPILSAFYQRDNFVPTWVIEGVVDTIDPAQILQGGDAYDFWSAQPLIEADRRQFNKTGPWDKEVEAEIQLNGQMQMLAYKGVAVEFGSLGFEALGWMDADFFENTPQIGARIAALPQKQFNSFFLNCLKTIGGINWLDAIAAHTSLSDAWNDEEVGPKIQEYIKNYVVGIPNAMGLGYHPDYVNYRQENPPIFEGWAILEVYKSLREPEKNIVSQWTYEYLLETHSKPSNIDHEDTDVKMNLPDFKQFFTDIPYAQASQWIAEINAAAVQSGNPELPFSIEPSLKDKILQNREAQNEVGTKSSSPSL